MWKIVWQFPKKGNRELPFDLEVPLISNEVKAGTLTNIYPPMFIVTLFTIAKRWKQPNIHEQRYRLKRYTMHIINISKYLNKFYIHTMEYFSSIKRNEILAYATWMTLEDIIMLRGISQTQTYKYCMVLLIWGPRVVRLVDTGNRMVAPRAGRREMESRCFMGKSSSSGRWKVLEMVVVMAAQHCAYCPWAVHFSVFKVVSFMWCVFYHNIKVTTWKNL